MALYLPCWDDPFLTEFTAEVVDKERDKIVLSTTYFHPEGGGQFADKGTMDDLEVQDVRVEEDRVVHIVPGNDISIGDKVRCKIDKERRLELTRAHTGSHILFGSARRVFGDVGYSGFGIGKESCRIDFTYDGRADRSTLLELEYEANRCILEDRHVNSFMISIDEIDDLEELVYAKDLPDEDEVRVVEIEGWDVSTCSGTHFPSTIFVGRIHVIGKKKLQEGVTRVEFNVGLRALEEDHVKKSTLVKTAEMLETDDQGVYSKVTAMQNKFSSIQEKLDTLEKKAASSIISGLSTIEIGKIRINRGTVSLSDINALSLEIKKNTDPDDIYMVMNQDGAITFIASIGENIDDIDASELVNILTEKHGGGGGGTKHFAQGGGLKGEPENMLNYILGIVRETLS